MKFIKYLFISVAVFQLSACAVADIPSKSIVADSLPKNIYYAEVARKCDLAIGTVTDKRPINETTELDHKDFRYFVPLGIWFQWSLAGSVYAEPKYYDYNVVNGVQSAVKELVEKSNICSGDGSQYVADIELLHLYGVEYSKGFYMFSTGGAVIEENVFFPTGYASINISVKDKTSGKIIGSKIVSDSFLFNEKDPTLSASHIARAGLVSRKNNHVQVTMLAMKRLLARLPGAIDEIISQEAPFAKVAAQQNSFDLIRMTKEYDFIERMKVEFDSGKIVDDQMVFRDVPVISKPNEWIVSPFNKDGKWMPPEEYKQLVTKLSQKYNVDFGGNMNAAVFSGLK